jgi:hypothetical protein
MHIRNVSTTLLLMFVAASLITLAARTLREYRQPAGARAAQLADGVSVVYFHGKLDCSTCRDIEAYAREAVTRGLAAPLPSSPVEWREVDFDERPNEHFKQEFDLVATSLLLVEVRGGRPVRWKMLPDVWSLVGDKAKFVQYVRGELRRFQERS